MSAKIILTVTEGKLQGQKFIFDSRTSCIIGRAADCYPQIPNDEYHSTISRYHCLLDINPPDIRIRDLGSLHGTYVNEKLIGQRPIEKTFPEKNQPNYREYDLQDGDRIKLSHTIFQVTIEQTKKLPSTKDINQNPVNKFNLVEIIKGLFRRANTGEKNLSGMRGYDIVSKLGEGGFSEVFLARHQASSKLVALKVMLPKVAVNDRLREMFLREIKNTKKLNHPHVIKLWDYCFAEDMFFFVLEYCHGGTVLDLIKLRGGKLEIKEAVPIILQVLDALDYAHSKQGLVHRDIKPANIFLTVTASGENIAKLGDYGLAKAFDLAGLSGQTMTGTQAGTPLFMPRQQVLNFKYVKPEVDVWATAATFYYMLTGTYPRDFSNTDPFLAILQTQPIPIRKREPSIPKSLAELIDLALIDNPKIHFKNALAFKNALLSII
jgi:pSer/pThr/pTyr-binding forkhead associated (FHA) protein